MRVLAESPHFILGHAWEDVILVDKSTGDRHSIADHYGDPQIGLISQDESWFITGGEGIVCYHMSKGALTFLRRGPEGTSFVHSMRFEAPLLLRILIDPWSNKASVWQVDLGTSTINKIQDGPFIDGPYQENVPY